MRFAPLQFEAATQTGLRFLPAHRRVLCTLQRAMWCFQEHPDEPRPADFKLATLCQYFGVAHHAARAHEALADLSATVALWQAIRKRSPNSEQFLPVPSRVAAPASCAPPFLSCVVAEAL